jgi:hypothetical protein
VNKKSQDNSFLEEQNKLYEAKKNRKSSQHTLMEPQNLEARTEIVGAMGHLSSMISSDKGKDRLNTLEEISD